MQAADLGKKAVGHRAAELVRDGMIVGLGTGSTAYWLVERLGQRVAEGLSIVGIPTSERTADQARGLGIPLGWLDEHPQLDLAIDGADQIDPRGQLIKGLGGALVREKRVARAAREFVVIADSSKEVSRLGVGCPVPVEIAPGAIDDVVHDLARLGAVPVLRRDGSGPYVTDNEQWIVDAHFDRGIDEPETLERLVNEIDGVVDNGLFTNLATRILVADGESVREWRPETAGRAARG
ncbi:MAG: ribose-5-phosphate isomerase RpiA [bacterium]